MQQYFELRCRTIQGLRQANPPFAATPSTDPSKPDAYPHKFHVTISIPNYISHFDKKVPNPGDRLEKEEVNVAGRLHNIRSAGAKLRFYDLHAEGEKIQIMASQKCAIWVEGIDGSADRLLQ